MVNPMLTAGRAATPIGQGTALILLAISSSASTGISDPEKVAEHASD
jgi:hypothetical protein